MHGQNVDMFGSRAGVLEKAYRTMVTQVRASKEASNGRRSAAAGDLLPRQPSKLQDLIKETHERTEQQRSEADVNFSSTAPFETDR